MSHFPKVLVTLIASAAFLVPAGVANAGTKSPPASQSSSSCSALIGCFSILDDSNVAVLSGINALNAVQVCPNLAVVQVTALGVGQKLVCINTAYTNYKFIQRTS